MQYNYTGQCNIHWPMQYNYTGQCNIIILVNAIYTGQCNIIILVNAIYTGQCNIIILVNAIYTGQCNIIILVNAIYTGPMQCNIIILVNAIYTGQCNAHFPNYNLQVTCANNYTVYCCGQLVCVALLAIPTHEFFATVKWNPEECFTAVSSGNEQSLCPCSGACLKCNPIYCTVAMLCFLFRYIWK